MSRAKGRIREVPDSILSSEMAIMKKYFVIFIRLCKQTENSIFKYATVALLNSFPKLLLPTVDFTVHLKTSNKTINTKQRCPYDVYDWKLSQVLIY